MQMHQRFSLIRACKSKQHLRRNRTVVYALFRGFCWIVHFDLYSVKIIVCFISLITIPRTAARNNGAQPWYTACAVNLAVYLYSQKLSSGRTVQPSNGTTRKKKSMAQLLASYGTRVNVFQSHYLVPKLQKQWFNKALLTIQNEDNRLTNGKD